MSTPWLHSARTVLENRRQPLFRIREQLSPKTQRVSAAVSLLGLFAAWCLFTYTGWISPGILPSPTQVSLAFIELCQDEPGILRHALTSIFRIVASTTCASLVAIPLGLVMGCFPRVGALLRPVSEPLRYLPVAALVPLSILWLGLTEEQKIFVLFLGTVVYLLPLVIGAVERVDSIYLRTGYTLGATRAQTVLHVILPIALPGVAEGVRVINGIGWTYVILAEVIGADMGLGHMIHVAQQRSRIDKVYVAVVLILLIGIYSDRLLFKLNKALFPWAAEYRQWIAHS